MTGSRAKLTNITNHDRESSQGATSSQLKLPADASKLKKHITLMCDRLQKGLRPH